MAIVVVLALAVIAILVSVLLTSNSNQEIQSLQLEIENLRETGNFFNEEVQLLRQMLNTTAMKLSILQTDTMTRDGECIICK